MKDFIFKINKARIDKVANEIARVNPQLSDIKGWEDDCSVALKIQAAILLSKKEDFADIVENEKGAISISKVVPVRYFNTAGDHCYFVKYKRSFIHIPKTGGRHLIYKYFVFQVGGNHMFAKTNSENYGQYTEDFKRCFTIVRNPFSWLYSYWAHISEGGDHTGHHGCRLISNNSTFEKFIFNVCNLEKDEYWFPYNSGMTSQIFDIDEKICVSDIIFFEKYSEGIMSLNIEEKCEPFLSFECQEKHRRFIEFRQSSDEYKKHYTDEMIDAVSRKFKFDLDFLGYDFNGLVHKKSSIHIPKKVFKSELSNIWK